MSASRSDSGDRPGSGRSLGQQASQPDGASASAGVDPVLEVIEPHEPPLHGLEHECPGAPFLGRLCRRVDHGPRQATEPKRPALDDWFAEQGRGADVDPGDPPRSLRPRYEQPDRQRERARRQTMQGRGRGARQPGVVTCDELSGHEPLLR